MHPFFKRHFAAPVVLALMAALAACASGSDSPRSVGMDPAPKGPPKLIVAISVDQFSADLFAQYRPRFTGGLARLEQGAVFPSGFQSHAATETCPGHSTLLTGVHPARSGIIANNWFDLSTPRAEKKIYCAEDESDPASSSREPVVSAVHLKVPTLGDLMKAANPASRNVAVSAKDRAVMMMGGHKIDAAYWYLKGQFVTLKGRDISPAAVAQNAELAALIKKGAPALAAPAWCAAADRAVPVGKGQVGTGRFALEAGKPDSLRISPRMDAATVALANRLVDELDLGKGAAADVLSVSLSATDYVGHATGTEGMEMCIQMAALDQAIGQLLTHLDARGIDYAVVLSADHGGLDMPERQREQALPRAVRADVNLSPQALGKAISARTGITAGDGPLLYADGPFGDFYVSRSVSPAQKGQVVQALVSLARSHPQVAAAFTAEELAKTPPPSGNPQDWSLKDRARASFDPNRSGDVVILLDRAVTPIPEAIPGMYVATHGSAFDYDRRVPMLFWRRGLRGFEQPAPVETVDIAPSLAALIGLAVPEGTFDGRCLDLDGGSGNTCEALK
ncbi:alkaline phosphatase family protein [Novosphingobium aquiterrae]|uniref:Alkaline phosphatase n=1 Tax=Novosphingobium aquiterrae TaxID=624388 RepID=A0ABV6PKU0_9SPHN